MCQYKKTKGGLYSEVFEFVTMLGVILFALILGSTTALPTWDGRVVGGSPATLGEIPYIVSIRVQNRHNCGGSIINDRFVLTAAHCVYGGTDRPELFSIQYGIIEISELVPNVLPVKNIIAHEEYEHGGKYPNDVAIIEVDGKFVFGPNAQPVELPTPFQSPFDGAAMFLAGWGLDKTGGTVQIILRKVWLILFTDEYCSAADSRYDSDLHICAGVYGGGKGQCSGDSGGPLVDEEGLQFGIVSWSVKPCANPKDPGMYTKVTSYRLWIREKTGV